jgi:hypothetical protein
MSSTDEQPTTQQILQAWQEWRTDIEKRFEQLDAIQATVDELHGLLVGVPTKDGKVKGGALVKIITQQVATRVLELFNDDFKPAVLSLRMADHALSDRILKLEQASHGSGNGADPSGSSHIE